jgi:molybdopterin molybdotransferase
MVLDACRTLGTDRVSIADCSGRVLATSVPSLVDSPRFDNSAVDGFGITAEDALAEGEIALDLVTESAAGSPAGIGIVTGQAARVFTGAPLPDGTAAVVMQEHASANGRAVTMRGPIEPGLNIRRRSEEYAAGEVLLLGGTVCSPPVIAAIAAAGHASVEAFRLPRVSILTTGDELVEPGSALRDGQIYASNGLGLLAALKALGIAANVRHVTDDLHATRAAVQECLADCDVLITSGGVSVGSRDYVKQAFAEAGVEQRVWGVAMKPGQPFYFGTSRDKLVFGLPGNPVSVLVTYLVLVKPALEKLMGLQCVRKPVLATLGSAVNSKPGKLEFVRGRLENGVVEPIDKRGSHMVTGLAGANCLIHVTKECPAGTAVQCTELRWSLD